MKNSYFTTIVSAVIVLSMVIGSCSSQDSNEETTNPSPDETPDNNQVELCLSTLVEKQSRAAFTAADIQLSAGRKLAVWVYETTANATALYEKNVLTANGSGGLSGGTTMFFPQNDTPVDVYALHTNATLTDNSYPSALTHTVNADQRTLANYVASDLLYAKSANIAKTTNAIPLTFYHLLSKLQVAIKLGDGLTASDITGVTIDGIKLQAKFTLDKTATPTAAIVSPTGSASLITIGADMSTDFTNPTYNDVIIVPQTVTQGTPFVTLHLSGGVDLAYLLPTNVTFESRKKYIYQITVSRTGIALTTSVVDWTSGGVVAGEASHLVN